MNKFIPDWFLTEFQQDWFPTEQSRKTYELAKKYHAECEAYDRTVCTGPIREGSIMPNGYRELGLINRNAHIVRKRIIDEALQLGITREEIVREIARAA